MFTSNVQISPPSLVLNCKVAKFCIKEWPKAVNLKRIPTHKECKCREFSLQTRLGGEICSSDVIMHKGHSKKGIAASEDACSSPEALGLPCNKTTWPRNDGLWGREWWWLRKGTLRITSWILNYVKHKDSYSTRFFEIARSNTACTIHKY